MKKLLLSALVAVAPLVGIAPEARAEGARVCTRHYDGQLNVRSHPTKYSRTINRLRNEDYVSLSGHYHTGPEGFRWFRTSYGGWVRGDYLCKPPVFVPQYGNGNY